MRFIHNHFLKLLLLTLVIGTFSCNTEEYPMVLDNYEQASLGELESLEIRSGSNRVLVQGVVKDPDVSEVRIYWNDRSSSVVIPANGSTEGDTISRIIEDLEEGMYVFEAQTFDDAGNSSEVITAGAEVFGPNFANRAGNREVVSNVLRDSLIDITYSLADRSSGIIGTEFIYENTSGESQELFLSPEENSLFISNFGSGSTYSFRTLYVPSIISIDTVYTDYAEFTPVPLPKVIFVTDGSSEDDQFVWLQDQGFFVTKYYNSSFSSAPQEDIDVLNAADLVIIGRSGNSGHFAGDDKIAWNALTVPLILNSQYAARDSRMNWFDNAGNPAAYNPGADAIVRAQIQEPGDIAFEGITFNENNLLPWLNTPVNLLYLDTATNGQVLAVSAPGDAENEEGGAMLLVRFDAGTEFYEEAGDAPAGPRTYFGFGADAGGTSYYWQLTDEAKQVYFNEINRMVELME